MPVATDATPRYEAENALTNHVTLHSGSDAVNRSNGAYIGGIDFADSSVSFSVIAAAAGYYDMVVTYAAPTDATHTLTLNGQALAPMAYVSTGGYLNTTAATAVRNIYFKAAGANTITFGKGTGAAELDSISLLNGIADKYEAETAARNHVVTYTNGTQTSGGGYVGGIDFADSSVTFTVTVPEDGLYDLTARYAASGTAATQLLTVNGDPQGQISYPATAGWSNTDLLTAVKLVALRAGTNTIMFTKGTAFAELDFIALQHDTHRYEAETATTLNATASHFPNAYTWTFTNDVVGVNNADSGVSFVVDTPVAGTYTLQVAYGNGLTSTAVDSISVNGTLATAINLPPSIGWLGNVGPDGQTLSSTTLTLPAGLNTIKLLKVSNFAELDYLKMAYVPSKVQTPTPPTGGGPMLSGNPPTKGVATTPAVPVPPAKGAASPPPVAPPPPMVATMATPISMTQLVLMPDRRKGLWSPLPVLPGEG